MRKAFFDCLHKQMAVNKDIYFLTADVGFGLADKIRDDYPDRFFNVGAAEVTLINAAVGLALSGKIPYCYTITSFLLKRPYEAIDLYVSGEKIKVNLIGSGRADDYKKDGASHHCFDDKIIMKRFSNINAYWPNTIKDLDAAMDIAIMIDEPVYINLKR